MVSFLTVASKHEYNPMVSFQTTANRCKYCLLFFMHRNEVGLLAPFAKINKRGSFNKVQGGGKKSKRPLSSIKYPRVTQIKNKMLKTLLRMKKQINTLVGNVKNSRFY